MIYLLDTNIVSHALRGDLPLVRVRLAAITASDTVAVSAVTAAEVRYGVARRGYPKTLTAAVETALAGFDILPWTDETSHTYARLRAQCELAGTSLSGNDMLIASHAAAIRAVLITRDRAFYRLPQYLTCEDWSV